MNAHIRPNAHVQRLESRRLCSISIAPVGGPTSVVMTEKNKLVIDMDDNGLAVTRRGPWTVVTSQPVAIAPDEFGTAVISYGEYRDVRSIAITGTDRADVITLGDGVRFATVEAGAGDDTIRGGDAASAIHGGDGDDEIRGGAGADTIYGGAGDDRLYGEADDDVIFGQSGSDRLWGNGSDDRLDGGSGVDRLDGGRGRNRLAGGDGADYITRRSSDDKTDGDADDRLIDRILA